ncbi:MAG: tRNA pseudouridine(13) synthase TruD, partial [Flavobacteriales bacterium]
EPEDFQVEELPAYLPSGEGEHFYLWVEKRDVSAEYLTGLLSRTLGISRDAIGTAGQSMAAAAATPRADAGRTQAAGRL